MHHVKVLTTSGHAGSVLCLVILLGLFSGGCATTSREYFVHQAHRGAYALSDGELKELRFYISKEVLAHALNPDGTTTAEDVVILPMNTPGKVTEVGSDWLRVTFTSGGAGVFFMTSGKESESLYKLATEAEGRRGIFRFEDLSDRTLLQNGKKFRVIYGEKAFLLVDQKDLDRVISGRRHLTGG